MTLLAQNVVKIYFTTEKFIFITKNQSNNDFQQQRQLTSYLILSFAMLTNEDCAQLLKLNI